MTMDEYLKGQTIKKVRPMLPEEMDELRWETDTVPTVLELSSGNILIPARDAELNAPGYVLLKREGRFYGV
jgi:hypothetical protein